jgi:hypothetical protein
MVLVAAGQRKQLLWGQLLQLLWGAHDTCCTLQPGTDRCMRRAVDFTFGALMF